MQEALKARQKLRFDFLRMLYDHSGGGRSSLINAAELGELIGLTTLDELRNVVDYLEGEYLIEVQRSIGSPAWVKLSHQGILEIESAISKPDQATNHFMPINVLYVNQMIGSSIQQGTSHSTQANSTIINDTTGISEFIALLESKLPELSMPDEARNELAADIATIKAQSASPKPKNSIIKECLASTQRVLEGAVGGAIGTQLATYIPPLLAMLA